MERPGPPLGNYSVKVIGYRRKHGDYAKVGKYNISLVAKIIMTLLAMSALSQTF